jgi:hypothetical protein
MIEKVKLDSDYCITLTCPKCKKSYRKNLSNYKSSNKIIKFNCNCPCGYSFSIILDRRRHLRKKAQLTGAFIHDRKKSRGLIDIKNLSSSGIGFEVGSDHVISPGDILTVRFTLDDAFETVISKEVRTKRIKGKYIGNEFLGTIYGHDLLHLYMKDYLSED